jgi:hypothetical protein
MPVRHWDQLGLCPQILPERLHDLQLLGKWKPPDLCNAHKTLTIPRVPSTANVFGEQYAWPEVVLERLKSLGADSTEHRKTVESKDDVKPVIETL